MRARAKMRLVHGDGEACEPAFDRWQVALGYWHAWQSGKCPSVGRRIIAMGYRPSMSERRLECLQRPEYAIARRVYCRLVAMRSV